MRPVSNLRSEWVSGEETKTLMRGMLLFLMLRAMYGMTKMKVDGARGNQYPRR